MIPCSVKRRIAQSIVAVTPALLGLLLSGCGYNEYPPDLKYPLRDDVILKETLQPETDPGLDKPGEFPKQLSIYLTEEKERRKLIDPANLKADQRQQLDKSLEELFGTPASPKVDGITDEVRQLLKLEVKTLAEGSHYYRLHCLHCHGLPGNGQGPTSPWVNPHPRDYRQGVFKFTSTGDSKPSRADLLRTLREGLEGTSMPSFRLLSEHDLEALVSYVIHLSLRGEVEMTAIREILGEEPAAPDKAHLQNDFLSTFVDRWSEVQQKVITPGAFAITNDDQRRESIERGRKMFTQAGDAGCIACHKDYGRQSHYMWDAWGTIVRPADLTTGVYRGGRRPIDLYWRVHGGIKISGMPGYGAALKPEQIWDIVNFVQVLPYPNMRKKYDIDID